MNHPKPELIQFLYSHYNEKIRWALDYKSIAHTRRSLLPGPHALVVKRLTGDTLVPIVRMNGRTIDGSARIIEEIEATQSDPALYPTDPSECRRALKIQAWFDDEIGPLVRRSVFAVLFRHADMIVRMFAADRNLPTRIAYRAIFPLGRVMMKKSMGLSGDDSVREGDEGVRRGLDFVAREVGSSGYLVGDRFSVADLTAASLLAPAVQPPDSPMDLPRPKPAELLRWLDRWADHEGLRWVREQYRRHRASSAEVGI